jgi:Domain of unknown function DUF29
MKTTKKWHELSTTSHYQTAVAVEEALDRQDYADAKAGIQELIDALARSEKRALRSQLVRLMMHIIKWKSQPERRSISWSASIKSARYEIEEIQEDTPSLNRAAIKLIWDKCFKKATTDAVQEMADESAVDKLTWAQVFDHEYELNDEIGKQ